MIRDVLRSVLVVATLAAAASILVDTRLRLAAIDACHRQAVATHAAPQAAYYAAPATPPQPEGRLQQFGRAVVNMADAAIGVVR
jgi:hypothetical protein